MTPSAAELLSELGSGFAGVEITALDLGHALGFRVKETETHYIEVVEQLVNWRVVATEKRDDIEVKWYAAGYCYLGKGVDTFVAAVLGAAAWDGPEHGDPPGWDKNAFTGAWNPESTRRGR